MIESKLPTLQTLSHVFNLLGVVSLKAKYWDHFCSPRILMISQILFQKEQKSTCLQMILLFFYSSENICDINGRLNVDLRSISLGIEDNKLTLNARKTKAMFCSQPKLEQSQNLKLFLNDDHRENVTDCKYLGVVLDQTMSWKPHVNQICLNLFINTLVYFTVSGSG